MALSLVRSLGDSKKGPGREMVRGMGEHRL